MTELFGPSIVSGCEELQSKSSLARPASAVGVSFALSSEQMRPAFRAPPPDARGAADLRLQARRPRAERTDCDGNSSSAFPMQRLSTRLLPAARAHLSALMINGSTLHAAVYLGSRSLPCGGPLNALFCFHPSSACRYEQSLIFLKTLWRCLTPVPDSPVP